MLQITAANGFECNRVECMTATSVSNMSGPKIHVRDCSTSLHAKVNLFGAQFAKFVWYCLLINKTGKTVANPITL